MRDGGGPHPSGGGLGPAPNLGLVRFYSKETTKRLEQILDEIATRPRGASAEESIGDDYGDEAAAALDELF